MIVEFIREWLPYGPGERASFAGDPRLPGLLAAGIVRPIVAAAVPGSPSFNGKPQTTASPDPLPRPLHSKRKPDPKHE